MSQCPVSQETNTHISITHIILIIVMNGGGAWRDRVTCDLSAMIVIVMSEARNTFHSSYQSDTIIVMFQFQCSFVQSHSSFFSKCTKKKPAP